MNDFMEIQRRSLEMKTEKQTKMLEMKVEKQAKMLEIDVVNAKAKTKEVAIASMMTWVEIMKMDSLSDSSDWSSSDDSYIDELLQDDDVEMMSLLVDVQAFEDRVKLLDQRRGSKMGRLIIYRNRALGHEHLMRDYFAEVPTYPPRLFRRRYRMRRSLFVKIVIDCEAAFYYFKREAHCEIDDGTTHGRFRDDLVEHHWHLDGRRIGP
ncbi:ATP-dependent zinc metalloprotease FTSH 5, mitochondrial [Hordeum vulgare]|nr:ATP-dependent zinc metalloprotease FTSH 5, mitochondrial [Hordeum vulgare]